MKRTTRRAGVAAVFGQVGAGQDADRRADHDRETHHQAADDGIEQAAIGAGRRRHSMNSVSESALTPL